MTIPSIKVYENICTNCGKKFTHTKKKVNSCSQKCRIEKQRQRTLKYMRNKRRSKNKESCVICGYAETIDVHHEKGEKYFLCPNHHALITRKIRTFKDYMLRAENEEPVCECCSQCNTIRFIFGGETPRAKFCPNCGRRFFL